MKKVMILGASKLQLPAISIAKDLNLNVVSLDMDKNAIGFKYSDSNYLISTLDTNKVLEVAQKEKIDGILTIASDRPMTTIAKVGERLSLNTISTFTAEHSTNKNNMRECLKNHNVPIPMFFKVNSREEFHKSLLNFSDSTVIKPVDNSGSRGIYHLDINSSDIERNRAFDYSGAHSPTKEILIEEFMKGPEVSVESISRNGNHKIIAITDKITTGSPYFVELGHCIPTCLDENNIRLIHEIVINALNSIQLTEGPAHTEVIVTEQGPKIVEIGARLGGDNITTHLVPLATGINMVKSTIEIAIGMAPSIPPSIQRASAILYFTPSTGYLKEITGLENAKKIPGVKEIWINVNPGDYIHEIRSSSDRVGHVIVEGENNVEAMNSANKVLDIVKFIVQ